MKTNVRVKPQRAYTYEGGRADAHQDALTELTRAVSTCMLYENTFYEKGSKIAERIAALCRQVEPKTLALLAREVREAFKLRHVPLFLAVQLIDIVRGTPYANLAASTIEQVVKRPDEMSELLAIYWRDGKKPLPKQLKLGLARAFNKFSAFQLAKWDKNDATIKLRDVMFLTHPKPKNDIQAVVWKMFAEKRLPCAETWESELSAGKDKKTTWERLINENKLGVMALLMNLRNMESVNVDRSLVRGAISKIGKDSPALPFRFINAAKHAPAYAQELSEAMCRAIVGELKGSTKVVIDVSGSMTSPVSGKSQLARWEAAAAMAILLRELCKDTEVYTFAYHLNSVANYRGLAMMDGIRKVIGGGTNLRASLDQLRKQGGKTDRVIVITDEQSQDGIADTWTRNAYLINVAGYQPGLDTNQGWTRFSGWSERIADYISFVETGRILSAEDDE